MRKFNDYLKNRSSMSIIEMAHEKQKIGGETVHETLRTPIFLDHEDINFLRYFPPKFWGQAYAQLINTVLPEAEKNHQSNQNQKMHHDFVFGANQDGSGEKIVFKNIPVGENVFKGGLHHKMTGTVDAETFKSFRGHPSPFGPEGEEHYSSNSNVGGKKGGKYGFDPTIIKAGDKEFMAGLGELKPETVHSRIRDIQHGIKQGWLANNIHNPHEHGEGINISKYDPDSSLENISHESEDEDGIQKPKGQLSNKDPEKLLSTDKPVILGERKHTVDKSYALSAKKLITGIFRDQIDAGRKNGFVSVKSASGEDGKAKFSHAEFSPQANLGAIRKIDNTGTVTWVGEWASGKKKGKPVIFRSKVPVMFPSNRIKSSDFKKGNALRRSSWVLDDVLKNESLQRDFLSLLRTPDDRRKNMQIELERDIKSTHESEENWMRLKMLRALNDFNHAKIYERMADELIKTGQLPNPVSNPAPTATPEPQAEAVEPVVDNGALKRDVLMQHISSFSPELLLNTLRIVNDKIKNHAIEVQQQADRHNVHGFNVKKFAGLGISPVGDNYTGIGTTEPNKMTAEQEHGGLPDWAGKDRGELKKYLGLHGFMPDATPYVATPDKFGDRTEDDLKAKEERAKRKDQISKMLITNQMTKKTKDGVQKVALTARKRKELEVERNNLEMEDQHNDREMYGPIGKGINMAISQLSHTAKGPALKNMWNDLFTNALREVGQKAGQPAFQNWHEIEKDSQRNAKIQELSKELLRNDLSPEIRADRQKEREKLLAEKQKSPSDKYSVDEKKAIWNQLYGKISNIAKNYVARIYQLNIDGLGTRRKPVAGNISLSQAVGDKTSVGDYVDAAEAEKRIAQHQETIKKATTPEQLAAEKKHSGIQEDGDVFWAKSLPGLIQMAQEMADEKKEKVKNFSDDEETKKLQSKMLDSAVKFQIAKTAYMMHKPNATEDELDAFAEKFMRGEDVASLLRVEDGHKMAASTGINTTSSKPFDPAEWLKGAGPQAIKSNPTIVTMLNRIYSMPETPEDIKELIRNKYSLAGVPIPTSQTGEPLYTTPKQTNVPISQGLGRFIRKPNPPVKEWLIDLRKKYNQ